MKATGVLERENSVIQQVAGACGICAEALRGGAKLPADVLEGIVDFFRQFGDNYHRREEEALLSLLQEKGISAGSCPIAVFNYENQKRNTLVGQLSSAVCVYLKSGGTVTGSLIDTLDALAMFLPDHIWKEDYLLLPMAEKVLSEEDKRAFVDSLNRISSKQGADAQRAVEKFSTAIQHCMTSLAPPGQAHAA